MHDQFKRSINQSWDQFNRKYGKFNKFVRLLVGVKSQVLLLNIKLFIVK